MAGGCDGQIRLPRVPGIAASNPLGVKGAGEAGTVGALPVLMSVVLDALRALGVEWLDMPATPERVWRAIREAGERGRRAGLAPGWLSRGTRRRFQARARDVQPMI